jgi:endonuclease YncB( thermonuclease family)
MAACLCACEAPAKISGRAKVIDGDSLEIGATSIRLFGVDAPEGRQSCSRGNRTWSCGAAARRKLQALVGSGTLECIRKDIDRYGRTVAVCKSGNTDLGAEMALAGLALAYRRFSNDYVDQEDQARTARRGLWAGTFTPPWDWRGNPQTGAPPAPLDEPSRDDCAIKGNINRAGNRIYHVPGSRSYEATRIDTGRGERWFCSEADALGAGWRAPRG